jgi:chaperonin GroES
VNIKALQDRVVVKRVEGEGSGKEGGSHVPESAEEKPQQGEVVALGEGKQTSKGAGLGLDVKVGDRILFAKYSGSNIKIEGEEYLILREDEILGVLPSGGPASGLPGGTGTDTD